MKPINLTQSIKVLTGKKYCILLMIISILSISVHAQEKTVVKGRVLDAKTKEALPYANVMLKNGKTPVSTVTNEKGYYHLETSGFVDTLYVSYIGYIPEFFRVKRGKIQDITISLRESIIEMNRVDIVGKREKYSKKNNPAVDMIEKVITMKSENRMENLSYYQFRQHEKMELSITNISDSAEYKKSFKKFNFIFDNVDTSSLTGKRYLPFQFSETIFEKYFRKNPQVFKAYIDGQKSVEISKFFDAETMDVIMREIFGEVNIYNNNVMFLSNQFMSPLSPLAPDFYRFFILDTTEVSGTKCYKLGFYPRNASDFGFTGNIYVTADSHYAVKRTELQLTKNSQVNYVKELWVEQEYSLVDSIWVLTKDITLVDFALIGNNTLPFYGRRENAYSDFKFNVPQPDDLYRGAAKVIRSKGFDKRDEIYWDTNRIEKLTQSEAGTYQAFKRMDSIWVYKFIRDFTLAIVGGYVEAGLVDIGPLENMLSWNTIEGVRFRVGGKTNGSLNHHFFAESFFAYGTRDEEFKYNITGHYSFNKKKHHPWEFPINLLSVTYEYDTKIPGQAYLYGTGDRFTLSIGRGTTDKMTFERRFEINYKKENINYFTYDLNFKHLDQYPLGQLSFGTSNGKNYNPYTTMSLGLSLRFAPNEKFVQPQQNRYSINMTAPVYELDYQMGINGFWGGDYGFHKLKGTFLKRWFISSFGFLDIYLEGGKLFNQVPYPSLFVHHANQDLAFQDEAYNTMRFFEFVTDQYIGTQFAYCFNGLLFNRIPLIKKLKWREYITFKALFGSISDRNDPEKHPDLMVFPHDSEGNPTTFSLNDGPFMEASIGVDNIFTFLRVDLVKRLSYLDHPNIQEWSVRLRLRFTF